MGNRVFKWNNDFNTGDGVIDSQHYILVKMINELLSYSINNTGSDIKTISMVHESLLDYINVHFFTEEKLMKEYMLDSRHVDAHINSHKNFTSEVNLLFKDKENLKDKDKIIEIVEYLIRWLACHILNTDKSLVKQIECIKKYGISPLDAYDIEEKSTESCTEPLLNALKVLYLLVSKKNREIEHKNIELEKKVEQRTKELSLANEKLSSMLYQDDLTNLPNRRFVMEEVQRLIYNWERYHTDFSILFIDIDKFKSVNDNYGHEAGDKVLKWISKFLRKNIRKTDIACRLGGDEFLILCSNTKVQGALELGKKLNRLCCSEYDNTSIDWIPSISIGVSSINDKCMTASELLKKADNAMYISKTKGGGTSTILEEYTTDNT